MARDNERRRAERPRGVVHQHDVRGARASASRPARTEACRVAPPDTGAQQPQALGGGLIGAAIVGWITGCTSIDLGVPGEQRAGSTRITGSPRQLPILLGQMPPARSPRPAATTTAATEGPMLIPTEFYDPALRFSAFPDERKRISTGCEHMLHCSTCAGAING